MNAKDWLNLFADGADFISDTVPNRKARLGVTLASAALKAVGNFLANGNDVEDLIQLLEQQEVEPIQTDLFTDPEIKRLLDEKRRAELRLAELEGEDWDE